MTEATGGEAIAAAPGRRSLHAPDMSAGAESTRPQPSSPQKNLLAKHACVIIYYMSVYLTLVETTALASVLPLAAVPIQNMYNAPVVMSAIAPVLVLNTTS